MNEVFNGVSCVKIVTVEEGKKNDGDSKSSMLLRFELKRNELLSFVKCMLIFLDEVQPYCTQTGCVCPHGYKMIEYTFKSTCRAEEPTEEADQQTSNFL